MKTLKAILASTEARRFAWTCLNVLMGMLIVALVYLSTKSPEISAVVLPVAVGFAQLLTKFLNQ